MLLTAAPYYTKKSFFMNRFTEKKLVVSKRHLLLADY
jgi:hypothetical protein